MGGIARGTIRKFAGLRFRAESFFASKKIANESADGFRKNNWLVRVTKVASGYMVWTRRK